MRLACFVIDDSANSKFCSACDKLLLVFQILGNISFGTMLFFMSSNFSEGLLACQSWLNFVLRRCSSYFLEPKQLYFGSKALLGFRKFLEGQVSYSHHFSSVVCRPSSVVNISHFNLLLRNHETNCNQTLVEWSLDGPLSNLCPVIPTSNQDGRQAKHRKKGG